jgi:hypothetical protein
MPAERLLRIAVFVLLWGTALFGERAGGDLRTFTALAALLLMPGWWIAGRLRPGSPFRVRAPLAFGTAQGVLSLLALVFHLAGLPLWGILAPLFLIGAWSAAAPPAPEPEARKRAHTWALAAIALLLIATSHPTTGFLTDAYDHIGTVRFQEARGDPLPGEYFHDGEEALLDPRKGTNHTAYALATAMTGVDPSDAYRVFWAFHVALIVFTVFWLAESLFGAGGTAWTATIFFLLLFRAGLPNDWFGTAGYPGKAGVLLCYQAIALGAEQCRRKRKARGYVLAAVIGSAAAGVHAFAALLAWLGLGALAAGLFLLRRLREDGKVLLRFLAANAAGGVLFLAFRWIETFPPSNPLHLHTQGVLLLPGRLAVIDPVDFAQVLGVAGLASFLLLPFLSQSERGIGVGEMFLISYSLVVILLLFNPLLFPWIEGRIGYLSRRLPLLLPAGFIPAVVMRRGWEGRPRIGAVVPALMAGAAVAVTVGSSAARMEPRGHLPARATGQEAAWKAPLSAAAPVIPAESTVLTDPFTGYALYETARIHLVALPDQHSSPNDPAAARRIADAQRLLRPGMSDGETDATLDKYHVDYLLINELFPSDFRSFNAYYHPESSRARRAEIEARPDRFERVGAPEGLHLFRVVGGAAPAFQDPPRIGIPVEGPRFDVDAGNGLLLLGGRFGEKRLKRGGGAWLVTSWQAAGNDAGALPIRISIRGRLGGTLEAETLGLRRDPALRPWAVYPLGAPDFPYLLWRKGDVVNDRHFVCAPLGCEPGTYEMQIAVDEMSFFPVRKLAGLARGATREAWIPIDTVEVIP